MTPVDTMELQASTERQVRGASAQDWGPEDLASNPSSAIHIPWGLGKIPWPPICQILMIIITTHKHSVIIMRLIRHTNISPTGVTEQVINITLKSLPSTLLQ